MIRRVLTAVWLAVSLGCVLAWDAFWVYMLFG